MGNRRHRVLLTMTVAVTALAVCVCAAPPGAAAPSPSPSSASTVAALRAQLRAGTLGQDYGVSDICAANKLACQAQVVTVAKGSTTPLSFDPPIGYGANELAKAYRVTGASSRTGAIVVIGAGADPSLESDLAVYRSTYGLPPCTAASGCFAQLNYLGGPPYGPAKSLFNQFREEEIAVETSLDVEMASAACPLCKIISMQVPLTDGFYGAKKHTHNAVLHFATGVQTAKGLGAGAVNISYGYPTDGYTDKGTIATMMTQPGLPIVASSGDSGFFDHDGNWPQDLSTVTSVGGTSLYPKGTKYAEVAWNGAGSGCTPDVGPALGQPEDVSNLCYGLRSATDISAVADPYTGVAVYDSYAPASGEPSGWILVGGTSVASPFIAGLYARAPADPSVIGPNTLYAKPASAFNDVLIGTNAGLGYCETVFVANAVCDAGPGWDGPTGLGTPVGLAPFLP